MESRPSLQNLEKALESLDRAIAQPKNEFSRDSVIQRFEYTLDLSWKAMKKFLDFGGADATGVPKEIVRKAAQVGWLADPKPWFEFIAARNETSHSYNESTAEQVYLVALQLPSEVRQLISSLKKVT